MINFLSLSKFWLKWMPNSPNKSETDILQKSSFPKQYDSLFHYSPVLLELQTWNCSGISANQNKNNFTFANLTKHVNNQTNFRVPLEILKKIWICLVYLLLNNANNFSLAILQENYLSYFVQRVNNPKESLTLIFTK